MVVPEFAIWRDERQAFDPKALGTQELIYQGQFQFNEVYNGWWPQLVVANESGLLERQGVTLRIKPDGSMTYVEEMDAVVKTTMKLHHLPFDNQSFEVIFKTLGFDRSEVLLVPDPANTGYRMQGVTGRPHGHLIHWNADGCCLPNHDQ